MRQPPSNVWLAGGLALGTLILYSWRLDVVPAFLKYEEVFFALESHAIANSLHDTNGRLLPMYFQVYENAWYQPLLVYWGALFRLVLPLSDAAVRVPTAVVGAIDVVLIYAIGLRLFRDRRWAVLGAVLLATTPPHFILGRVVMDYIYPVPFALGWLLAMLVYLETHSLRALVIGSALLGVGFFSYIAAAGLMPGLALFTMGTLYFKGQRAWRPYAAAIVPFAAITGLGLWLALQSPEYVQATMDRYGPGRAAVGDPFQRLRELLNYTNLSARAALFSEYFNWGYLFFSGGSNPVDSTRTVGVYLLPLAAFMAAGLYSIVRRPTIAGWIVLFGFVYSVVPAATIMERYAVDRHLTSLPFGVLIAVFGVRLLWSHRQDYSLTRLVTPIAAAGAAIALLYATYTLGTRGQLSQSPAPLLIASVGLYATARWSDRLRTWAPVAVTLLLLTAAQFLYFLNDYYGDYRLRSAPNFASNLRGAIEQLLRLSPADDARVIAVSNEIPFANYYVRLYAAQHGRADFPQRVRYLALTSGAAHDDADLFVTGNDLDDAEFRERAKLETVATIHNLDQTIAFVVSQRPD